MHIKRIVAALVLLPALARAEDNPHGPETFQHLQVEASAGASRREGSIQRWEMNGWIGGDTDKLAFSSEGKRLKDTVEDAEVTALASHALSEFWDVQVGVRQEFRPHPATYAAIGVEGAGPILL